MKDFRQLKVWEKAHLLALAVYPITARFPREETYGLTAQIRRAACSIPSNIAEGCGGDGDAELARFCVIARGSATELEYQLLLARDLKLLQPDDYERGPRRVRFASRVWVGSRRDGNVGAYAELHVRCGNDPRTPFVGGSENSVVRPNVSARNGRQRGEFGNQVASVKDDLGGPVAPPALQTMQKPAVRQFRQTFGRDGRPRNVTS